MAVFSSLAHNIARGGDGAGSGLGGGLYVRGGAASIAATSIRNNRAAGGDGAGAGEGGAGFGGSAFNEVDDIFELHY